MSWVSESASAVVGLGRKRKLVSPITQLTRNSVTPASHGRGFHVLRSVTIRPCIYVG